MNLNRILLIIFFSLPICLLAQEKEIKPALLIIDVQAFYFPGGFNPLVEPEIASQQAAKILKYFRSNNDLVIHIKHATEKDSLIHQNVLPITGEKVIKKSNINSFKDTDLLTYLNDNSIDKVIICGMMTHMCVEAAARASTDFGFDVIVIDDACATRDIIYKADTVKASDVHHSTLGTINKYYGKVLTVEEYINQ